jgi:hypothetical protein
MKLRGWVVGMEGGLGWGNLGGGGSGKGGCADGRGRGEG